MSLFEVHVSGEVLGAQLPLHPRNFRCTPLARDDSETVSARAPHQVAWAVGGKEMYVPAEVRRSMEMMYDNAHEAW